MSEEKKKPSLFGKLFGKKSSEDVSSEDTSGSGDSFLNELIELSAEGGLDGESVTDAGTDAGTDADEFLMKEIADADTDGDGAESTAELDAFLEEMFADCIKSKEETSGKEGVTDTIRRIRTAAEEEDLEIPEELLLRMDEYTSVGGNAETETDNDAEAVVETVVDTETDTETETDVENDTDNDADSDAEVTADEIAEAIGEAVAADADADADDDGIDGKLRELFSDSDSADNADGSYGAADAFSGEFFGTADAETGDETGDDTVGDTDEGPDMDISSIAGDIGKMNVEDAILMEALGYDGRTGGDTHRKTVAEEEDTSVRTSDMEDAFAFTGREYHSRAERDTIKSAYAAEKLKLGVRLGGTALMAIILFVYDVFGKNFGGAFNRAQFPVVNILIGLQILLIAAAFSYKQLFYGVKGIFNTHPTVHSVSAVVVTFTVLYDIILAIIGQSVFTLYNFPAALCLVFTVFSDWLRLDREIRTFDKVSSWNGVCTLERVDGAALARELGEGSVGDDGGNSVGRAYKLLHGKMPENYFHRVNRRNPMLKVMNYVIAPVVALALVIFIISLAANRTLVDSLNIFIVLIQFGLPAFMAVAAVFPFYNLSTKKLDNSGVILNEVDTRDYATVDALVFDEGDLFGKNSLTVSRLTMCGNGEAGDIYDVLAGSATILGKMGGTIANALRDATPDVAAVDAAELLERADNGVIGTFGGKEYVIGTEEFLSEAGIAVSGYYDKDFIESTPGGAVLHIAVDGREALKLSLTYRIDPGFAAMAQELSERKIRMILRCTDPCVDDRLLGTLVGELSSPITILKNVAVGESANGNTVDGGILADSEEWSSVMKAADACSLFRKWSAFNLLIMGGIMALGILLAAFLGALGTVVGMSSLYVVLFQVLAILPTVAISKLWLE